jgi:hypothetical protein
VNSTASPLCPHCERQIDNATSLSWKWVGSAPGSQKLYAVYCSACRKVVGVIAAER